MNIGSIIKSYDFPGLHQDFYIIGEVVKIENGIVHCNVLNHVVQGKDLPAEERADAFSTPEQGLGLLDNLYERVILIKE